MPGLAASTALLFRVHARRVWWSRRALACLALAAVPPVIAWAAAAFDEVSGAEIATNLGRFLLLQVVLPLVTLVAGSAVVTEEIEDRTITYLFSRPIPRAAVLLGRWAAAVVLVSALLALSAVLTATLAAQSGKPGPSTIEGILGPLAAAAVLGGAVYTALFAAAGVLFRYPMIVGLGYAFAIEGFLANLPGRNQALTVQYYLRSLIVRDGSAAWLEVEGLESLTAPSSAPVATLLVVTAAVLLLASWRISRREFVLSA